MTMTFSPQDRWGCGPEKLPAQPYTSIHLAGERWIPTISVTFLGQVHLLKKGLNDNVPDVCTTEQSLNSLKKPNGSFNRQAIISSQTTEVRNTVLSPPGFDKRAHGNLTITNISKHPISRSIEFPSPPPERGYGGTVAFRGKKMLTHHRSS